jgi:hypothetical protein
MNEHYEKYSNFIKTKTEPCLFWIPANDNTESKKLLEESKNLIKVSKKSYEYIKIVPND